ncbi:MAG: hypothetical protein FD163_1874 [Hyphomonadaceae bacterium]|nr:MAG: hypothetical protein FD128_2651 [Hyphomonadaceae bacterium]KAF0184300.1 MAG: hypothetical protein FD163_1874 [Hyphomonadaceae bacterium]
MTKATFSSKGQIVIPKELRDEKGIVAGVIADAVNHPEGILLRIETTRNKHPISELFGIMDKYKLNRSVSVEEMNEAISEAVVERYERSRK